MPAYNIIRHPSPGVFNPIGHTETQDELNARRFRQLQNDYFSGKMKWADYKAQADALSDSPVTYQSPTNYGGGVATKGQDAVLYEATPESLAADKLRTPGVSIPVNQIKEMLNDPFWQQRWGTSNFDDWFNQQYPGATQTPIDANGNMTLVGYGGTPNLPPIPPAPATNPSAPQNPAINNPYLPQPTGNPATPATTANPPTVNIDNAPANPTTNLSGGISPQGQYNPAGGTFVNPRGASPSRRRQSANNYFNRNWFGGNIV